MRRKIRLVAQQVFNDDTLNQVRAMNWYKLKYKILCVSVFVCLSMCS